MKSILISLFVLIQPLLLLAQPGPSAEMEVRKRFDMFAEAFQAADADVLSQMLTEDYVHTGPTGNVSDKTDWLDWIRSRRAEIDSGNFHFDSYEMVDVVIRVYGDAAIVTGLNEAEGVREGKPFTHSIRFTNVWVRDGGEWKRAAFHDSHKELIINN
jgi:ketosteroid isomerase-like protein